MQKLNEILSILNSQHSKIGSRISAKLLLFKDATGKQLTDEQLSKATGLPVDTIRSILAGIHPGDADYQKLETYINHQTKKEAN